MYRLIVRTIMGLFSSNKVYGRTWQEDKSLRQPLSKDEDYNNIEDIEVVVGEYGLSARISCKEGDVFKSLDKETSGNVILIKGGIYPLFFLVCCVREGLLRLVSQRAVEVVVCCVIEGVDACRGVLVCGV